MPSSSGVLRRLAPALTVLAVVAALFVTAQLPSASAATRGQLAARFQFTQLPIALPPGLPERNLREVNPQYEHIRSWISSVGAAVAVNDLDGQGAANDLCVVDTRSDSVIVTPAPGTGSYAPFVLDPAPLPMSSTMAPMGCVPGDFNLDGHTDLLAYYWGRTPVLFLNTGTASLAMAAFRPAELVARVPTSDGLYHGPRWNTNAVAVADFDGDGRPDIGVFNYFPDTEVLNPQGQPTVQMNDSMSRAQNAGGAHILHWTSATATSVSYEEQESAIPVPFSTGWTLGAGSADLDGDLLPELYVANDFGNDRFFQNVSTPGQIRFRLGEGVRGPFDPKSLVVGHDSFKGMSMDFGDLLGTGKFDMFISNITTSWGLEESNMVWRNNAKDAADARAKMDGGTAPFTNKAAAMNMAWIGWGWDAKMADFDNSGQPSVVQAAGFVTGTVNRFSWLQELAMTNDLMLREPSMWPKAEPGDDIAGTQPLGFWVRETGSEKFVNLNTDLGFTDTTPSRGIAVADADADGRQDFAVARQWAAPSYFRNSGPAGTGDFLGLRLYRPTLAGGPDGRTPAYGAQVTITTADGKTHIAQLDGGSGHSGKRSFDVFFGLGRPAAQPVGALLCWRDLAGATHMQQLDLTAGWHDILLTDHAQEVQAR